jgi:galactokinase
MDNIKRVIVDKFKEEYGYSPDVVAVAPGRLEVLGNHTDYNEGFVLSTATDLNTIFAVTPVEDKTCSLNSFDNNLTATFDIDALDTAVPGDWSNYIKGVVYEISRLSSAKNKITAFNAGIMSSVPLSAGMSSSAALEISACFALGKLFGVELSPEEWAKLGQRVENNYLGLKSGLLDQFSSIFGKKNNLIFCDFREIKVLKRVQFPREYEFVVANSMVEHNLVESDYNLRRKSCENAVEVIKTKFPGVKALRDVSLSKLKDCKEQMDIIDYKRALHIVGENERVLEGIKALENNDIVRFGALMYESHKSSINNFENSCPELDYLVELSKSIPGCVGARLSGGGFGGISIHLVKKNMAEQYKDRLKTAFKIQTGTEIQVILCGTGDGAVIV